MSKTQTIEAKKELLVKYLQETNPVKRAKLRYKYIVTYILSSIPESNIKTGDFEYEILSDIAIYL